MPAHKLFIGFCFFFAVLSIIERCCRKRKLYCIRVLFALNGGEKGGVKWNEKPEATNQKKEEIPRFFFASSIFTVRILTMVRSTRANFHFAY